MKEKTNVKKFIDQMKNKNYKLSSDYTRKENNSTKYVYRFSNSKINHVVDLIIVENNDNNSINSFIFVYKNNNPIQDYSGNLKDITMEFFNNH